MEFKYHSLGYRCHIGCLLKYYGCRISSPLEWALNEGTIEDSMCLFNGDFIRRLNNGKHYKWKMPRYNLKFVHEPLDDINNINKLKYKYNKINKDSIFIYDLSPMDKLATVIDLLSKLDNTFVILNRSEDLIFNNCYLHKTCCNYFDNYVFGDYRFDYNKNKLIMDDFKLILDKFEKEFNHE